MHEYILALIGGTMIGLAAVMLMAFQGNVMGISGIASRLLPPVSGDWSWRISFFAGVLVAPLLAMVYSGTMPTVEITGNVPLLIVAGILVGAGTVIGNGCTSGHGVCGLSRLSRRSIVATGIFMLAAVVTVFIVNLYGARVSL